MLRRAAASALLQARAAAGSPALLEALAGAGPALAQRGAQGGAAGGALPLARHACAAVALRGPAAAFTTSAAPGLSYGGRGGPGAAAIAPARPPRNLGVVVVPERTAVVVERCAGVGGERGALYQAWPTTARQRAAGRSARSGEERAQQAGAPPRRARQHRPPLPAPHPRPPPLPGLAASTRCSALACICSSPSSTA
jgi:hypothetical protein